MNLVNAFSDVDFDGIVKGTLSNDEIEKIFILLNLVWPNAGISIDYLHWLYRDNPEGFAEVFNVWDKGEIVAHYAAIPVMSKLFGQNEKGLLSLNTAVHPLYRGKGYFKKLAMRTFDDAANSGAKFVVGVANANSTVLFRRQLKFQLVCPLTVKIGLGAINRLPNTIEGQPSYDFKGIWDEKTVLWRLKRPGANYKSIEKNHSISVLRNTGKYGIWANMCELDTDRNIKLPKMYFRWNPFTLWIGLDESINWARSKYVNLPNRFKASPLNLVFKDLTGDGRTLEPNKVLFSLMDFDAY